MYTFKRITGVFLVLAIMMAMFAVPASAAENVVIVPCTECFSRDVSFEGIETVRLNEDGVISYLYFYRYHCNSCGEDYAIDSRLIT